VNGSWGIFAFGGLSLIGGFVQARFPRQALDYFDRRGIPVNGVPRTVGGVRAMGIVFLVAGSGVEVIGFIGLFGAISSDA
jgi:hypothetical protein